MSSDQLKHSNVLDKIILVGEVSAIEIKETTCSRIAAEAPIPVYRETAVTYKFKGVVEIAGVLENLGIPIDIVSVKGESEYSNQLVEETSRLRSSFYYINSGNYEPEISTVYTCNGQTVLRSVRPAAVKNTVELETAVLKTYTELLKNYPYAAVIILENRNGVLSDECLLEVINTARSYKTISMFVGSTSPCKTADCIINDKIVCKCQVANTTMVSNSRTKSIALSHVPTESKITTTELKRLCEDIGVATTEKLKEKYKNLVPNKTLNEDFSRRHVILGLTVHSLVGKISVENCTDDTVEHMFRGYHDKDQATDTLPLDTVIESTEELKRLREILPRDKIIVATTGCFDLLHANHTDFLKMAKDMGDVLVVLLNTDISVKLIKGPERPIYNQNDRITILQSLKYVDYIVTFDERRPDKQMRILDPDILVKGDEYTRERIIKDYPFIRDVRLTTSLRDISTTKTIAKIRNSRTEMSNF